MQDENILLQTIRVPKNLLFLSDRLPRSNYEKLAMHKKSHHNKSQDSLLPDINNRSQVVKSAKKKRREDYESSPNSLDKIKKRKNHDLNDQMKMIIEKDLEKKSPTSNKNSINFY